MPLCERCRRQGFGWCECPTPNAKEPEPGSAERFHEVLEEAQRHRLGPRVTWWFSCGCGSSWGRLGSEAPSWSRCPECLTVVSYRPPAEQLDLLLEEEIS